MVSAPEQRRFIGVVLVVLIIDLITKLAAEALLPRYIYGVPVLGEFFKLRLVFNPGAAFGIHVGPWSRWVFMGLAMLALVVLTTMLRSTRPGDRLRLYSIALIFAGAAGNLVDRFRSPRGVVDFLDFTFGSFHFPTFNVADMGVSCGAALLAISLWNEGHEREGASAPATPAPPAPAPPAD
jgi:signal peptidase II